MDATGVSAASDFALTRESEWPRDLPTEWPARKADDYGGVVGPVTARGGPSGLVWHEDVLIQQWGDAARVDMAFSISKACLALVAGVAWDRGLLASVHEPVYARVPDPVFTQGRHREITWHHLLTQTSEWTGMLWGKPDLLDRRRGAHRDIHAPGMFWEYNDVRVNVLSCALTRLWGRGLADVFAETVMNPIGASNTWSWRGYTTSGVDVDGTVVEGVASGGHWGGGLFISGLDLLLLGRLVLARGQWKGRQVVSEDWIGRMCTPGLEPTYGYLWWLNSRGALAPGVPADACVARGGDGNQVWVIPSLDLVVVTRWTKATQVPQVVARIVKALR
jgi:CubicO group peptidase (beta-lactamase class C family)